VKHPISKTERMKRFLKSFNKTPTCWLCTKAINPNGYGACDGIVNAKNAKHAHRVSYILFFGDIPKGMCVLHKCDVRNCVNPKHLFLGTHSDNALDMLQKGRGNTGDRNIMRRKPWVLAGERSPNAVLSNKKATEIRNRIKEGYSHGLLVKLAKEYRVTLRMVSDIRRNKTYKESNLIKQQEEGFQ